MTEEKSSREQHSARNLSIFASENTIHLYFFTCTFALMYFCTYDLSWRERMKIEISWKFELCPWSRPVELFVCMKLHVNITSKVKRPRWAFGPDQYLLKSIVNPPIDLKGQCSDLNCRDCNAVSIYKRCKKNVSHSRDHSSVLHSQTKHRGYGVTVHWYLQSLL